RKVRHYERDPTACAKNLSFAWSVLADQSSLGRAFPSHERDQPPSVREIRVRWWPHDYVQFRTPRGLPRCCIRAASVDRSCSLDVDGSAIGEIQIARLGLSAIVAQGDSPAVLRRAVGHLAESASPGEPGNVLLAVLRDTFFRPLKRVRADESLYADADHLLSLFVSRP